MLTANGNRDRIETLLFYAKSCRGSAVKLCQLNVLIQQFHIAGRHKL